MPRNPLPAMADACAPDTDRAGSGAPTRLPGLLREIAVLLVLALLRRMFPRHFAHLPWWWNYRADLPPGSAQQLAAATRGEFGTAIAWMCRRRGIGPGHPDWPYLARTIVAFGGSIAQFRPGLPACGLQWWEHPQIVPGTFAEDPATPAADALAALLSRHAAADAATPAPHGLAAVTAHRPLPHPACPPPPSAAAAARAATGPPTGPPIGTGPPAARDAISVLHLNERGQPMAGPAVPIRAAPGAPPRRRIPPRTDRRFAPRHPGLSSRRPALGPRQSRRHHRGAHTPWQPPAIPSRPACCRPTASRIPPSPSVRRCTCPTARVSPCG